MPSARRSVAATVACRDGIPSTSPRTRSTTLVARHDLDPGVGRRRDHGLRLAGGGTGAQHRPQRAPRRRVPRFGAGHHRRPPVRLVAAGDPLRRAGRDGGRVRRGDRGGRREHEPGADGFLGARRRPVRRPHGRAVPRTSCPRGSRPSSSPSGGGSAARSSTRSRSSRTGGRRAPRPKRASTGSWCPCRSRATGAGELMTTDEGIRPDATAERLASLKPGVPARRRGHRGELVADQRRRGRGARHQRGGGGPARADATGAARGLRGHRLRPDPHAHRAHPGHHAGARPSRARARRRRPGGDQRGVRQRRPRLGARGPSRHGTGQRERRRHRPGAPAGLFGGAAPGHARCASSSAAAAVPASR